MLYFAQQLLNGLHMGMLYALLGFGYALVNGMLHRTNLAHGALFGFAGQMTILGAVFGWQALWLTLPLSLAVGLVLALAFTMAAAAVVSRHVLEPLAERSPNALVVATLGTLLVLMELGRIASDTRDYWLPPLLSEPVVFAAEPGFSVTLTGMQLVNSGVGLLVMAAAALIMARGRFGRDWRAVRDDPRAASLCGLDPIRVFRTAMLFGSGLAAMAGSMAALYYGNIGFGAGLVFGLKVLFVTAAGSYSDPGRAALGAGAFGVSESLWSGYFPIEWRDAWIFALLAAWLVLRRGALGMAPERH